jgi:molybdate/tungstate transport system substrate-binding protein
MRRVHPVWVALVALAAALAGLAGGYLLRPSSGAGGPGAPGSSVLSISAAGLLDGAFPLEAATLANETPSISVPLAAQQYQGSLQALEAIGELHEPFDVAASADFRLIPQLLEPTSARWEVLFATSPLVLAYDPSTPALNGINSSNWPTLITRPGVLLGVANASTDPDGFNAIFALQLEGLLTQGDLSSLYDRFFSGPPGSFAQPDPSDTRLVPETSAATELGQGEVQAYFLYQAYAISHHLSFVDLSPSVDLGNFSNTDLQLYQQASTRILGPSGPELVRGAPIAFSATVPREAPNATLGELFVHLLLTPVGARILQEQGFSPLLPAYAQGGNALPPLLAPLTAPLPPSLANETT